VQNTSAGNLATYVRAQLLFDIDTVNLPTGQSIGLNIPTIREGAWPGLTANVPSITTLAAPPVTPGATGRWDWEGVLTTNATGTGGTLLLDLAFPAYVPSSLWNESFYVPFNIGGTTEDIQISFSIQLAPTATTSLPSITIADFTRQLRVATAAALTFNVSTENIPAGTHELVSFDMATGLSIPATIVIDANGEGSFTVTGTPTVARLWTPHIGIRLTDGNARWDVWEWEAYDFIRLDVRAANVPLPPEPTPTPTPPPETQPEPGPGNTVIVVVNNVTKVVINKTVISNKVVNVVNEARQKGERPKVEIELEDDQDGVQIGGGDVQELIRNDGILVIVSTNVSIQFNASQMANWNVSVDSEIVISLRPVKDSGDAEKILDGANRKPGNATDGKSLLSMMLTVLIEVNVTIDGNALVGDAAKPTMSVDISEMNLTIRQKMGLQGVFFIPDPNDPTGLTYVMVDGLLDGNIFTVLAMDGFFSLMSIHVEVATEIRLQVGSTAVQKDGDIAPSMDVAPFYAEEGNPDSLMLPLRAVAEAIGASVTWNAVLRVVVVVRVDFTFSFNVDEPLPDDKGKPEIVDDRTFIPRSFMAEMMEIDIEHDPATGRVYIYNDID
jgi:hypothetical protein